MLGAMARLVSYDLRDESETTLYFKDTKFVEVNFIRKHSFSKARASTLIFFL